MIALHSPGHARGNLTGFEHLSPEKIPNGRFRHRWFLQGGSFPGHARGYVGGFVVFEGVEIIPAWPDEFMLLKC